MMANLYIKDEAKEKLDKLTEAEERTISTELGFLINKRYDELFGEKAAQINPLS